METRADDARVSHLCDKFAKYWDWAAIPADGYSSGIIIFWLKNLGNISPVVHSRCAFI